MARGKQKAVMKRSKKKALRQRLKDEAKKEMKTLVFGSIAMVCSSLSNQAVPKLLGKVLDSSSSKPTSLKTSSHDEANRLLFAVVLGGGIASFLRTSLLQRAQDSITCRLRSQIFQSLLLRDYRWFQYRHNDVNKVELTEKKENDQMKQLNGNDGDDEAKSNDDEKKEFEEDVLDTPTSSTSINSLSTMNQILTEDVVTVAETITTTVSNTIRSTSSIVFATKNMIGLNSSLFALSFSLVPILGSSAFLLSKCVKQMTKQKIDLMSRSNAFAYERLDHVSTVQTSNRIEDEVASYADYQKRILKLGRTASLIKGGFMGFMFGASASALVCIFKAGGKAVRGGTMTYGELKSFVTYTFLLGLGTSGMMSGMTKMMQGLVSAERVYDLLDGTFDEDENNDGDGVDDIPEATYGEKTIDIDYVHSVSIKDCSFGYGWSPKNKHNVTQLKQVLDGITFDIKRGEVVALVGRNGCGKSTLASLLVALNKPQSGSISAKSNVGYTEEEKDVDLYCLDRKTQSKLVQLVPQQPALFEMSIWDNITYTNPNATNEEVEKALQASNCSDFISDLKEGVSYNIGRNGCNLSGGQRQRIALARALLSNPAMLCLDEANSSMDAEGDNAVADAVKACRTGLDQMSGGVSRRGLLLITHRMASLELADKIVVLKDGVICEQGTYKELASNIDSELCQLMPELKDL